MAHSLVGDPRLSESALRDLAITLPAAWVKVARGDIDPLEPRRAYVAEDAAAALDALPTSNVSLRLYHLELVPGVRSIGDEVLENVGGAFATSEAQPTRVGTGVFFASPGAVVSAHVDAHHNLLFQVRGTKHVDIGWFPDQERQQLEVERDYGRTSCGPSELPPVALSVDLGPGDGVYIPPYAFHWTRTGPDVSVALSVGWETVATDRTSRAYECNARMRERRLSPRPVGSSPARDRVKAATVTLVRRLRG